MSEGNDARKRECKSHIEKFFCDIPIACKEMHVAADFRMRPEHFERVVVRITDMEHERLTQSIGELDLLDERIHLNVFGTFVDTEIIESTFPYCDHALA